MSLHRTKTRRLRGPCLFWYKIGVLSGFLGSSTSRTPVVTQQWVTVSRGGFTQSKVSDPSRLSETKTSETIPTLVCLCRFQLGIKMTNTKTKKKNPKEMRQNKHRLFFNTTVPILISPPCFCSDSASVRRWRSGGPSSHHERQLVGGSPRHRWSHHVSLLQPVEGVPGEPSRHGAGPQINRNVSHQPRGGRRHYTNTPSLSLLLP